MEYTSMFIWIRGRQAFEVTGRMDYFLIKLWPIVNFFTQCARTSPQFVDFCSTGNTSCSTVYNCVSWWPSKADVDGL